MFFSEILHMRSPSKCLQKSVKKIVCIATYNACAKIVNPTLTGAPGSLRFLKKRPCFFAKNKSLSKITYQYFSVQTSIIKQLQTKFVLKSNIQDIRKP